MLCYDWLLCNCSWYCNLRIAIYDIVEIAKPEFTLSSYHINRHQSNDAFWISRTDVYRDRDKEMQRPSEEELTRQRLESYQHAIQAERRDAIQSLIKSGIIIIINSVIFLVHWRLARRARETNI